MFADIFTKTHIKNSDEAVSLRGGEKVREGHKGCIGRSVEERDAGISNFFLKGGGESGAEGKRCIQQGAAAKTGLRRRRGGGEHLRRHGEVEIEFVATVPATADGEIPVANICPEEGAPVEVDGGKGTGPSGKAQAERQRIAVVRE
jgi:hypothetical protein